MLWKKSPKHYNLNDIETPFFLIDENELINNVNNLKKALNEHWENYIIGYSFKTNSLPWLVDYYKNIGFYAEVVSGDEYGLALLIGYDKHNIIYNGPCKSKSTFVEAIGNNCYVNIDSQRELYWLKEIKNKEIAIGLRVNFDLDKLCPNESAMGPEGGRFGFCYENEGLKKAIDYVNSLDQTKIKGIHLHCSTKTRSVNVFKAISKIACEIKRVYKLDLEYIDIGGGFYGGLTDKPQFGEYFEAISFELSKEFDKEKTTLIVEPGTSLVSSPFSFVVSVIDVKKTTYNNFVVTDGSRINIDPLLTKSKYSINIKYSSKGKRKVINSQVIAGFTCMENDRIMILENCPYIKTGDRLEFEKVGAYTMSLSPLFIKYFPTVYLKQDNCILKICDKWTANDYLNNYAKTNSDTK
jgi:diaminopimelate decarboxylase